MQPYNSQSRRPQAVDIKHRYFCLTSGKLVRRHHSFLSLFARSVACVINFSSHSERRSGKEKCRKWLISQVPHDFPICRSTKDYKRIFQRLNAASGGEVDLELRTAGPTAKWLSVSWGGDDRRAKLNCIMQYKFV